MVGFTASRFDLSVESEMEEMGLAILRDRSECIFNVYEALLI
jgi:hypothetical protein